MAKKLSDFTLQKANVNRHKVRGMGMLDNVIATDGWQGAITVAANGETFAGSARLEVSYDRFGEDTEPITVHTTGDRPVIVIRDDIPTADDPRAIRLGIADNRISELNYDPDIELLAAIAEEVDISDMYFEDELAALVARDQNEDEGTNDPVEVWQGMPEFNGDAIANKSIHVHFESMDDYYQFAELVNQKLTDKTRSIWFPPKPESIAQVYVAE